MNRKISFRGYNLKNKQWIYGYYLVNRGKHYIVQDEVVEPFKESSDFEVDAESVGQYVGTIKGVELYEGDYIIHRHTTSDGFIDSTTTIKSKLVYNKEFGQVMMYCVDNRYTCRGDYSFLRFVDREHKIDGGIIKYKEEYEVFGNEYEKNKGISTFVVNDKSCERPTANASFYL